MSRRAAICAALVSPEATLEARRPEGRHFWLQVARGSVRVNGQTLSAGDGAATSDEPALKVEGVEDAELLLFDLA